MLMPITISTTGFHVKPWERLRDELSDMRTPLTAVSERLLFGISKQFETEGAYGANRWTALSPKYAEWKLKHGGSNKILAGLARAGDVGQRPQTYTVSGKMRKELLSPSDVKISPKHMVYIAPSEIASYHQKGTDNMPERPIVPIGFMVKLGKETDLIFRDWIDAIITKSGL